MEKDKEKKGLWAEFKEFISRGNVMDLAVGVVIGSAFSAIVNSLVNDIIMPVVGVLTAGVDFKELKWVIRPAVVENGVTVTAESAIGYGAFVQAVINFLIIAVCIFLAMRQTNRMMQALARRKAEAERALLGKEHAQQQEQQQKEAQQQETTQQLLTEILAELKAQNPANRKEENIACTQNESVL